MMKGAAPLAHDDDDDGGGDDDDDDDDELVCSRARARESLASGFTAPPPHLSRRTCAVTPRRQGRLTSRAAWQRGSG